MDRKIATKRSTETKTESDGSERHSARTAKTKKNATLAHEPRERQRDI
jgi:hypothetical protein